MKTFRKIIFVVTALIAMFIVLFNLNNNVWYETHVLFARMFAHEDGLYCLTPYTCMGIVHEYETLYNAQMAYMDEYGINAPGRPMQKYQYNSDMHAYVRWLYY